jgi:phosphatidylinositol-3-phosphatase
VKRAVVIAMLLVLLAPLGGASAKRGAIPRFDHVVVIVIENKARKDVLGNADAPYFNSLAAKYTTLPRYGGIAHPSLPNYIALVSGGTQGIHDDCTSCIVSAKNLADTLEHAHLTWKSYAEGIPHPGFTGASAGLYAKRHVPFLYFRDIVSKPARLRRVVPLSQFGRDLKAGRLPSFAFVTPNVCHDMHDCPVAIGDRWLRGFVGPLLRDRAMANSVIFVVADEPRFSNPASSPVPALALGPLVVPHSYYGPQTSHYGLLRTIEDAWGLPRLGKSAHARPIAAIWR